MSTPALNPLVSKIRGMHPGAYDDMDDATLTKAVLAKYPQYSDLAVPSPSSMPGSPSSQPMQPSYTGMALHPEGDIQNPQQPAESFALAHPEEQPKLAAAAGIGAAGIVAPTVAPIASGVIAKQMAEHPILGPTIASYLIGKAREIPGVGKMIPSGAELMPYLVGHGKGATTEEVPTNPGAPQPAADELFQARGIGPGGSAPPPAPSAGLGSVKSGAIAQAMKDPGAPLPETPDPELLKARTLFNGPSSPADPAAGLGTIKSGQISQAMKDPGAPLPAAPDPQLLQARSLFSGPASPPDPAAGLGSIKQPSQAGQLAEAMQKQPAEVAPGFNRGQLGNLLDQSLGAKKLEPKVPLRQQMPATASPKPSAAASAADVPEGHTPVTSSALRSYKYDPAAREFHARMTSGDTGYVYGDVSPEDVQAFENSDSKGQAFQQIKRNALVAKIVNGKRLPVKAAAQ